MQKILYITSQVNPGGIRKYVLDMAKGARDAGNDITVASIPNKRFSDILKHEGITFREIQHFQSAFHFITDIQLFFSLYKLIRNEKPNVLHLNGSKIGALGAFAGKLAHVPKVIFTAHGWAFNELYPWWQKRLIIFISRFATLFQNKIICTSHFDKTSALLHHVAPESKIIVIHNGIDIKQFYLPREDARKILRCEESSFIIGTIANFYKKKSLDTILLAAISAIHDKPESKFVLIGDGPERSSLENLIKKYHLQNQIVLVGSKENAAQYMKAFDVFVLPSKKESLPYVILEALAAKVPCIVSSVGGISEIIEHEKNGLLLKHVSPGTLWDAILYLTQHKKTARELQSAGFETVKTNFSLEHMIRETLVLYGSER